MRLGRSRAMHGGKFTGRQPEPLTPEEWESAIRPTTTRCRMLSVCAALGFRLMEVLPLRLRFHRYAPQKGVLSD